MKVVLLNDTDGRENIGCRLTSASLKEQITTRLPADSQPIELTPFPWHFGKGRKTNRVWMSGVSLLAYGDPSLREKRFVTWLTELARQEYGDAATEATFAADLVVFHPEGSISNNHGTVRILNLLSLPMLACLRGIPTFTINGTFPLYPSSDRRYQIIQHFLNACRFVALRDRITAEHYGVTYMPDAAIMHRISTALPPNHERPYILITTGASLSKRTNLAMAQTAIRFADEHGLKPLILTKKHKDLKSLNRCIRARGGNVIDQASLTEAEAWLAQCALHIGGRYHMALFGLLLGVPSVLMLTNTHKNKWLAEDFAGISMADDVSDITPTAATLFPFEEKQQNNLHQSVHKAKSIFEEAMGKASSAISQTMPNPTATATEALLASNMRNQLRASDFMSFWPFGIRLFFRHRD